MARDTTEYIAVGSIALNLNTSELRRALQRYRRVFTAASIYALKVVAAQLLKDAKLYVPVLTGALKDSGRVEEAPQFSDALRVVRTVFGSADVLYAYVQHEVPFNHPSLGMFGPARYLSEPLRRNWDYYQELLQEAHQDYMQRRYRP